MQGNFGAVLGSLNIGNGKFAFPFRAPLDAFSSVGACFASTYGNFISNDKARVKTYAELTNQFSVFLLLTGELLKELSSPRARNGTQVGDHVFTVHADAVIPQGNRIGFTVMLDFDTQLAVTLIERIVIEGRVAQLVAGVGGVRDKLA